MSKYRNEYYEEEEDLDEQSCQRKKQLKSLLGIPCKNGCCDQEIILEGEDYYCSRECYQVRQVMCSLMPETGEAGTLFKHVTIKGRGGTGLLAKRDLLDYLVINLDLRDQKDPQRTVTINNSSLSANIWRGKPGDQKEEIPRTKQKKKQEIVEKEKERKRKDEERQKLMGFLMVVEDSSDENSSSHE